MDDKPIEDERATWGRAEWEAELAREVERNESLRAMYEAQAREIKPHPPEFFDAVEARRARDEIRAALDALVASCAHAGTTTERVRAIGDHILALERRIAAQRHELARQNEDAARRNRQLDALHFVWCYPGCAGGMDRDPSHPPLTRELLEEAIKRVEAMASSILHREWTCALPSIDGQMQRRLKDANKSVVRMASDAQTARRLHTDAVVTINALREQIAGKPRPPTLEEIKGHALNEPQPHLAMHPGLWLLLTNDGLRLALGQEWSSGVALWWDSGDNYRVNPNTVKHAWPISSRGEVCPWPAPVAITPDWQEDE